MGDMHGTRVSSEDYEAKVKVNVVYNCQWNPISQLRSVTCHMGSPGVTFHLTQANTPRLMPSHRGRYSIYRHKKDGWLSKPTPSVQRATGPRLLCERLRPAGLEPRPRDRYSSTLTTSLSRIGVMDMLLVSHPDFWIRN